MFLLFLLLYVGSFKDLQVFVSYIRRYVLTRLTIARSAIVDRRFRLLYSEICSYCYFIVYGNELQMQFSSPIFGDMFLLLFDQLVDISTIIDIFNGTLNGQ